MAMEDQTDLGAEGLMLEAKKAILEEQHRRFQEYQAAGMWKEAMAQLQVTLGCAADLLKDSVALLERAVARRKNQVPKSEPEYYPPEEGQSDKIY